MEVDIRKIRCGGWDSSHINVKVNGRWRYLYKPNKLRPLNVKEPIGFTDGYKPPQPAPSVTKYVQKQYLINNEFLNKNRTSMNIPVTGSTLTSSQVDKDHPVRKNFLINSAINKPKAPYTFFQKDKKQRLNQIDNDSNIPNQNNTDDDKNDLNQTINKNQTLNKYSSNIQPPPAMTNDNFQKIQEQNKTRVRIRRQSHNSYTEPTNEPDIQEDTYSDLTELTMTQSSFSTTLCESSLSLTMPPPSSSGKEDDPIYFLTEAQPQNAFNHAASSRSQRILLSDVVKPKVKKLKEKRNRSIDGYSKPLMTFKCMVRPQVDSSFRGDTSKLDGIFVESNLPDDVKNYFIEVKERQKRLQEEQQYQDYESNDYNYN